MSGDVSLWLAYGVGALIVLAIGIAMLKRVFDPFAPVWLFLVSYAQIYVIQAISYHDWAVEARGVGVVTRANAQALGALVVFLGVYFCGVPRWIARRLPRAPREWSSGMITGLAPVLVVWGLICSTATLLGGVTADGSITSEEGLLRQFPLVMLIAGVLLIVTGRQPGAARPGWTAAGLAIAFLYCAIWMFNAKRSHSVFAVLAGACAYYLPHFRRPRLPVLGIVGFLCALVVSVAIGWRGTTKYEPSVGGFMQYISEFNLGTILVNLNMKDRSEIDPEAPEHKSKETEEYGGYLLMVDTVPEKSSYDYGQSYLRIFTSYIPRLVWPTKPLPGRKEWIDAWIAGSEFKRTEEFTGPAIGVLGAAQLNGGPVATAIVMAVLALLLRTAYDYFRYHAATPWAQAWWSMTFFNAWMMPLNDDPMIWFYYLYGHTVLPPFVFLWVWNRLMEKREPVLAARSAWVMPGAGRAFGGVVAGATGPRG